MLRKVVGHLLSPDPIEGGGGGGAAVLDPPAGGEGGSDEGGGDGGGASGDGGAAAGEGGGSSAGTWEKALADFPGLDDDVGGTQPDPNAGKQTSDPKPKPGVTGPAPKPEPVAQKPEPGKAAAREATPNFKTNKELRTWAEKQGDAAFKATRELETLRKEVETLRKNRQSGDVEALTKTNADLTKKVEDYEKELRVTRYASSDEYRNKYQAPIQNKTAKAFKLVQDLTVETVDPNDPEKKTSRQGTKADFQAIYSAPNRSAARKLAKQLFGEDADDVIRYRDEINDLVESANEAEETYKSEGQKAEQQNQAQNLKEIQSRNAMWIEANKGYRNNPKIARHFNEDPDDAEFNTKLKSGYEFIDEFFGPSRSKYTPQQLIIADTKIRNRAAALPAVIYRLEKAEAANAEKDQIIEKLRGSSPGGRGKSAGGAGGTVAKPANDGDPNYDTQGKLRSFEDRINELPE
jgi:hypothetical protein